jgi:hypothetical protein
MSPPSVMVSVAVVVLDEVTCVPAKLNLRRSTVSCPVIPATVPLKVVESSCNVPLLAANVTLPPSEPPRGNRCAASNAAHRHRLLPPLETLTLLMVMPARFRSPPHDDVGEAASARDVQAAAG